MGCMGASSNCQDDKIVDRHEDRLGNFNTQCGGNVLDNITICQNHTSCPKKCAFIIQKGPTGGLIFKNHLQWYIMR